eukprot:2522104-Rhodomonas_salina.1
MKERGLGLSGCTHREGGRARHCCNFSVADLQFFCPINRRPGSAVFTRSGRPRVCFPGDPGRNLVETPGTRVGIPTRVAFQYTRVVKTQQLEEAASGFLFQPPEAEKDEDDSPDTEFSRGLLTEIDSLRQSLEDEVKNPLRSIALLGSNGDGKSTTLNLMAQVTEVGEWDYGLNASPT